MKKISQKINNVLYEYLQMDAISSVLLNNREYFCRKVYRWYSETFHTPLHEVYSLDWVFVLQQYYEKSLESLSYNQVYEIAVNDYAPETAEEEERKNREFAEKLVEEQQRTLNRRHKTEEKKNKPPIKEINLNFEKE